MDYTVIGGKWPSDPNGPAAPDFLADLPERNREVAERALSQVMFASTGLGVSTSLEARYFADVVRKLIQRGTRPTAPSRSLELRETPPEQPSLAQLWSSIAGPVQSFQLDAAFDLHPTYEKPFWENFGTVAPALSRWLSPQASLEGLVSDHEGSGERWVDFLLYLPWQTRPEVIEIDGSGHDRQQGIDRQRDALLRQSGAHVRRLPGTQITPANSPYFEELKGRIPRGIGNDDIALTRWVHGPATLHRLAYAIAVAVDGDVLRPNQNWSIALHDPLDLAADFAGAVLDLLAAVDDLWQLGVMPEQIRINDVTWTRSGSSRYTRASRITPLQHDVEIHLEPFTPPHAALPTTRTPAIVLRGALLPVDIAWTNPTTRGRRNVVPGPRAMLALRQLLSDLFGYTAFRPGQAEAIMQTLSGGDSCVLLPTGAGKSLIYQLAGLLRPGVTIVVAPLQSLIDDQERRLLESSTDRIVAIHSGKGLQREEVAILQEGIGGGEALFVLVAPERLQIQSFRMALTAAAKVHTVNLAVVDEAHCVSEWGHSFRTSYLKLGRNLRRFCADAAGASPPIMALTATASPRVLTDMLAELGIDRSADGVLHRPQSFHRRELHYRVMPGPLARREQRVRDALRWVADQLHVLPADLGATRGSDTLSGIVFVPHASSGLHLGLTEYRRVVSEELAVAESAVAMFAGRRPRELAAEATQAQWTDAKVAYADSFRRNVRPVMVSTNAFGMGIDKPNIRYTIHVIQPGSIEAWAQEAGRAGRNGADSYCVLVSSKSGAERALNDAEIRRHLTLRYAQNDLELHLDQLRRAFPGAEQEVADTRQIYEELRSEAGPGGFTGIPRGAFSGTSRAENDDDEADTGSSRERALYRLQLIGVVRDYTIEYGSNQFTVYLEDYSEDSIRAAAREFVRSATAGNVQGLREIDQATGSIDDLVGHFVTTVINTLYQSVEPARVLALRAIYDLTGIERDESELAEKINAYLSDGPIVRLLEQIVEGDFQSAAQIIAGFNSLPPPGQEEWAGAAQRFLEGYPDHPVLLFVRALGEAWRRSASRADFDEFVSLGVNRMSAFGFVGDEADALVSWCLGQLRSSFDGLRWSWTAAIWQALESTGTYDDLLDALDERVFSEAARGSANSDELDAMLARRLRRSGAFSRALTSRFRTERANA